MPQIISLSLQRRDLDLCQATSVITVPSLPHPPYAEPVICNYFQSQAPLQTDKIIFQVLTVTKIRSCIILTARVTGKAVWEGHGLLWMV